MSTSSATVDAITKKWESRDGFRVGDIVIMPNGDTRRIGHIWGPTFPNRVQITTGAAGDTSFHIQPNGFATYSGSLERGVDDESLELTDGHRLGDFWYWPEPRFPQAGTGEACRLPCRVFRVTKGS